MNRTIGYLLIVLFACCFAGIAALEDTEQTRSAKFESKTELVEIRTVVTDPKGGLVEGLSEADFELLENGSPQKISNFEVSKIVGDGTLPVGVNKTGTRQNEPGLEQARERLDRPPVRTILLYVDALHLSFSSLNYVKQALNRFIDEQLTDQDLVAFVSSESLGVAQQFTRDRRILRYAAEQIRPGSFESDNLFTPNLAHEVLEERTDAIRVAVDLVRREKDIMCPCKTLRSFAYNKASEVLADATLTRRNTLAIIEHYAEQMAGLPGKRMIVIFSDGFTSYSREGETTDNAIRQSIGRVVRSGVAIYAIDAQGLQGPPMIDAANKGPVMDQEYEAAVNCFENCDKMKAICLERAETQDAQSDCFEAARRCKQDCLRNHPSPLLCSEDEGEEIDPVCAPLDPGMLDTYVESSDTERLNGLNSMALDTGGKMYSNTNDLTGALGSVLDDNRFYYVLSYYPTAGKEDNRFRRIEVRVRNHPEYKIRTPIGYQLPAAKDKPENAVAQTPQQKLIQAMQSPLPVTNLGVTANADYLETESDDKQVSLDVSFEGDRFQYQDQGKGQEETVKLEILSYIFDSSGNQVEGVSTHVTGRMSEEDLEKARSNGYRFSRRLALKPGAYQVRIGVREENSDRMGTASTWIEVPEVDPNTLEMSSLILSNPLEMDFAESEGMDISDLEQVKMVQGIPMYAHEDIFYYTFRVHPGSPASGNSGLMMMRELLQGGVSIRKEQWTPIKTDPADLDGKGWFDLDGEFDIGSLPPGVYELRISVKSPSPQKTVQRTVAFGIL